MAARLAISFGSRIAALSISFTLRATISEIGSFRGIPPASDALCGLSRAGKGWLTACCLGVDKRQGRLSGVSVLVPICGSDCLYNRPLPRLCSGRDYAPASPFCMSPEVAFLPYGADFEYSIAVMTMCYQ